MPAAPRAVLFDLDGTLIDSVPDIAAAVAELLALDNLAPLSEDVVRQLVGHGVRMLVQRAYMRHGIALEGDALAAKTAVMMGIYPKHLVAKTRLMPGAMAAIDAVAATGAKLGVVTNKPQAETEEILRHFGLMSRLGIVVGDRGPTETGGALQRKPAPDMLLYALKALDVPPAAAVMVGDSPADIQAARAGGIPSVAVHGGYSGLALETLGADRVIHDLNDLPQALSGMFADA